jgi:hypothetical protein
MSTPNPERFMPRLLLLTLACLLQAAFAPTLLGTPLKVTFTPAANDVEAYDAIEVTADVERPDAANPFTDASLRGTFAKVDGTERHEVEGFCDAADGSVFRIRFMPSSPGSYTYSLAYRQGGFEAVHAGTFQASDGHRRGPIRVDPKFPWHFVWEGTGEHYFFNGTTAHFLMGWSEDRIINFSLERLHQLKINRVRSLLAGAISQIWGEPVIRNKDYSFTTNLRPWVAAEPANFDHPGIDFSRFNIAYWQKWDRMLRFARDRDMIISVVLDISTHHAQPVAGSEDERRYIRYATARLSAFSNITWDLGDDIDSYRDAAWMHETGTFLVNHDPYRHLATDHPMQDGPQDRASDWFSFTSIQNWTRHQHALMLEEREIQKKTGRIIPQVNEEYGYEDHYPYWSVKPDANSTETLRLMAWEIAMAGAYGTAGETPRRGTGVWPNTGGGYINGRGDDTMVMLKGYQHMVEFFTSFAWWKTEPHDELVNNGAFCLAQPGEIYAVYLPKTGDFTVEQAPSTVTIQLVPGTYTARWFDAFTGETILLPPVTVTGQSWTSPKTPGWLDWALLLQKQH